MRGDRPPLPDPGYAPAGGNGGARGRPGPGRGVNRLRGSLRSFVLFLESFAPLLAQIKTQLALQQLTSVASSNSAPPYALLNQAFLKIAMQVKENTNLQEEQKEKVRASRWDNSPHSSGTTGQKQAASFGLSNEDLEELSRYPDDQLTPENMPLILRDIRMRKMGRQLPNVHSQSRGKEPVGGTSGSAIKSKVIEYGHASKYEYTEDPLEVQCTHMKDWIQHQNNPAHLESCRQLRQQYPDWNPEAFSSERNAGERKENQTPKGRSNSASLSPRRSRGSVSRHSFRRSRSRSRSWSPGRPRPARPRSRSPRQIRRLSPRHRSRSPRSRNPLRSSPRPQRSASNEWASRRTTRSPEFNKHKSFQAAGQGCSGMGKMPLPRGLSEIGKMPGNMKKPPTASGSQKTLKKDLCSLPSSAASKMKSGTAEMSERTGMDVDGENAPGGTSDPRPVPYNRLLRDKLLSCGTVLHISDLPDDGFSDQDIKKIVQPFGKVSDLLVLRSRNEAFLEMNYKEAVIAAVKYGETVPVVVNGRRVKINVAEKPKPASVPVKVTIKKTPENVKKAPPNTKKDGNKTTVKITKTTTVKYNEKKTVDPKKSVGHEKKHGEPKKKAAEGKIVEGKKIAEAKKPGEGKKIAEAKKPGEGKPGEGKKIAEAKKPGEGMKIAEAKKPGEGKKIAEAKKPGEGKKAAEAKKPEEGKKVVETKKVVEGKKAAEIKAAAETNPKETSKPAAMPEQIVQSPVVVAESDKSKETITNKENLEAKVSIEMKPAESIKKENASEATAETTKKEEPPEPASTDLDDMCVVLISNLPEKGYSVEEVSNLAKPFGGLKDVLILSSHKKAYLEINRKSADSMVKFYTCFPMSVEGNQLCINMVPEYKNIKDEEAIFISMIKDTNSKENTETLHNQFVHLGNLPDDGYTELEVVCVGLRFGKVDHYIVLKNKKKAILQLDSPESAKSMYCFLKQYPYNMGENTLTCTLSPKRDPAESEVKKEVMKEEPVKGSSDLKQYPEGSGVVQTEAANPPVEPSVAKEETISNFNVKAEMSSMQIEASEAKLETTKEGVVKDHSKTESLEPAIVTVAESEAKVKPEALPVSAGEPSEELSMEMAGVAIEKKCGKPAAEPGTTMEKKLEKLVAKDGTDAEKKLEKSVTRSGEDAENAEKNVANEKNERTLTKAHPNKGAGQAKSGETSKGNTVAAMSVSVKDPSAVRKMILKAVVSIPDISKSRVMVQRKETSLSKPEEQKASSKPETRSRESAEKKHASKDVGHPRPTNSSSCLPDSSSKSKLNISSAVEKGGSGRSSSQQDKDAKVESRGSSKQSQERESRSSSMKKDNSSNKASADRNSRSSKNSASSSSKQKEEEELFPFNLDEFVTVDEKRKGKVSVAHVAESELSFVTLDEIGEEDLTAQVVGDSTLEAVTDPQGLVTVDEEQDLLKEEPLVTVDEIGEVEELPLNELSGVNIDETLHHKEEKEAVGDPGDFTSSQLPEDPSALVTVDEIQEDGDDQPLVILDEVTEDDEDFLADFNRLKEELNFVTVDEVGEEDEEEEENPSVKKNLEEADEDEDIVAVAGPEEMDIMADMRSEEEDAAANPKGEEKKVPEADVQNVEKALLADSQEGGKEVLAADTEAKKVIAKEKETESEQQSTGELGLGDTEPETKRRKTDSSDKSKASCTPKDLDFLIPKAGYFCQICSQFYADETSMKNHCQTQRHQQNMEKFMATQKQEENNEGTGEEISTRYSQSARKSRASFGPSNWIGEWQQVCLMAKA
ncbi:zinc finger protein 638 [Alligator mississippiensis]|uniref:Zinc finger protein 638 n=1 Tax=Alligator mississippiensis TaxID=8496 RepID=A0A151MYN5_ALLMI|nr:zinc finger protein 638 [Alligator mississippiensis]